MGQKTQTSTSNQYNPQAYSTYNAFQPQLLSSWMQMGTNPLGSSYFQNQLSQLQSGAQQIQQRNVANSLQNLKTGGGVLSNAGGFVTSMLNRNTIGGSTMQANALNSAINSALQNRNVALASMQAYQPLQTGQNTTQQTSGLGTWLPQVAGLVTNALMPGINSTLGGNSFSSGYSRGVSGGGYSQPASGGMYSPSPYVTPWAPPLQMPPPSPYGYS